jgi:3-oxoacyl-[acyl-carrier-protein] synthase III
MDLEETTLTAPLPIKIAGLGRYLPERVVCNSEIESLCNLPPGWVEAKTGIRERRWVNGETNSFMAAQAAQEALANAALRPSELDLIINASGTQEQAIPDGGPLLQQQLGLGESGIPCFSLHATCLSFLMALDVAASFITTGRYRHILITSADIGSCGVNPKEWESASLLGDGAAAAVITPTPPGEAAAFQAAYFETYGRGADLTVIRGGGCHKHPNHPDTRQEDNLFHMKGSQILRLTHRYAGNFLERLRPGLSRGLEGINWVVPHQPSRPALQTLHYFGWPEEQIMITVDWLGNCVSASLPLTLYEAVKQESIRRGDEVLLVGTGAGLSLGGIILTY